MYEYTTPRGRAAASRYTELITAVRSRRLSRDQSRRIIRALRVLEQEAGHDQSPPEDILALAMGVGVVRDAS
ncbi:MULTISPECIES: hypothetical protein [unclassified Pseudonocardia]|uniref:hypothetical protein n=1 Tax=unclassified Pseudonocardia TaxID=2619320 RepID=UPI0001FFE2B7|nr:hypothetical protein [Pseudonocardia sp. Ae707_Ps1]OLM20866.1 hypothetical protein Ae707Ps1_5125c [Pseudonocardia sp. Ae707_Ps1]